MSAVKKHLFTADEFAALPSEGLRLELIRGEIVAMAPTFEDHGVAALRLSILLGQYVLASNLGRMCAAETGFLIAENPDTVRAPDLSFTSSSRVSSRPVSAWVRVMPDLVAEVVSSGDRPAEIAEKVQMWLDAGVKLVWVVYPTRQVIEVYQPERAPITLSARATLDGGSVVPGFSVPVAQVFE
ncbi:MAG TPA: Uma2 family endonuclease [Ktedonobacterales bacterium]